MFAQPLAEGPLMELQMIIHPNMDVQAAVSVTFYQAYTKGLPRP